MDAHLHAIFLAYGHDCSEEINKILAELILRDTVVESHQGLESPHGSIIVVTEIGIDETLGLHDDHVHEMPAFLIGDDLVQGLDLCKCLGGIILLRALAGEDLQVEICETDIVEIQG